MLFDPPNVGMWLFEGFIACIILRGLIAPVWPNIAYNAPISIRDAKMHWVALVVTLCSGWFGLFFVSIVFVSMLLITSVIFLCEITKNWKI